MILFKNKLVSFFKFKSRLVSFEGRYTTSFSTNSTAQLFLPSFLKLKKEFNKNQKKRKVAPSFPKIMFFKFSNERRENECECEIIVERGGTTATAATATAAATTQQQQQQQQPPNQNKEEELERRVCGSKKRSFELLSRD